MAGDDGGPPPGLMRYAGMGLELAGAIIGLTLAGLWIDWQFGTDPWGVLLGASLGIVGGMYNLIRQAMEMSESTDRAGHRRVQRRGTQRSDQNDETEPLDESSDQR